MLAVKLAAEVLDTTAARLESVRRHVAKRPMPRRRGRPHLILETRDPAHHTPRLRIVAVEKRMAAAVDIKAATNTGRS
jgi:hypothetical protein